LFAFISFSSSAFPFRRDRKRNAQQAAGEVD